MGLGKCTEWPFHDLDWHWLAQMCLSAQLSKNHSSDHYKTWQLCCHSHGYYLNRYWGSCDRNFYFGKFSLKIRMCFFKVKHYFGHISGMLVRLMWNKKEVHRMDTGHNMWSWPLTSLMTLTLYVSRSNFEIALSQESLVWLMWNEN